MSQIFYPLIKHGFQKFNEYSLPVAGADTLGGVKVGNGLSIDGNGVLSADGGGDLPVADYDTLGVIKLDSSFFMENGVLHDTTGVYVRFDDIDVNPSVSLNSDPMAKFINGWLHLDGKFTLDNSVTNEELFTLQPDIEPIFESITYSIDPMVSGLIPGYSLEGGDWKYKPQLFGFDDFVLSANGTLSAGTYLLDVYLPAYIEFSTL